MVLPSIEDSWWHLAEWPPSRAHLRLAFCKHCDLLCKNPLKSPLYDLFLIYLLFLPLLCGNHLNLFHTVDCSFSLWYAFRYKAAIVFPRSLSEIWISLTDTFVALGADPYHCLQIPLYFFLAMWLNNFNFDMVRNPASFCLVFCA